MLLVSDADWAGVYVGKSISCCCSGLGSKKEVCCCDIIYRPITGNSHDMWDFVGKTLFYTRNGCMWQHSMRVFHDNQSLIWYFKRGWDILIRIVILWEIGLWRNGQQVIQYFNSTCALQVIWHFMRLWNILTWNPWIATKREKGLWRNILLHLMSGIRMSREISLAMIFFCLNMI